MDQLGDGDRAPGGGSRPNELAQSRVCACGARLSAANPGPRCAVCERTFLEEQDAPPQLPPGFWDSDAYRAAFDTREMGKVFQAYRADPRHKAIYGPDGITQAMLGTWLGKTQAQISRIERGESTDHTFKTLVHWAQLLGMPQELLWFDLPGQRRPATQLTRPVRPPAESRPTLLKELLRKRHLLPHRRFCKEYEKVATQLDKSLARTAPSERQYKRWLNGSLTSLPYSEPCAVLEAMFPGYTAKQLFQPAAQVEVTGGSAETAPRIELLRVGEWNPDSVTLDVQQITGEDLATTRRETLAGAAIFFGAALTEPLQQWLLARPPSYFAPASPNFSASELGVMESMVQQFRKWNIDGNRALARKAVVAQLNELTERIRHGPSTGPLATRGFRLAAELAEVAASMSWDAGLQRAAQRYYATAVQLAKLANDDSFAAVTLAALARQCYDLGRASDGLEIVQLAQYGTRRTATPRLRALLATREAWSYAQKGEFQAFHRAARLAEDHFSEGLSDDDNRSVRGFDSAELAGVIGARFRDLAQHDPRYARNAQEYIRKALDLRHPSRLRNRAFDLIGLARAHLITSEPDYACTLIHQAIPIAQPWVAGRVGTKLREFNHEAERYAANPTVRDTREAIRDLTVSNE